MSATYVHHGRGAQPPRRCGWHSARRLRGLRALALTLGLFALPWCQAAAPRLLHTPGYEAPVQGEGGDLLLLAGSGFSGDDRVVYATWDKGEHPPNGTEGVATIVQRAPSALTVRLPGTIDPHQPYRLWVVNGAGEWSEPVAINDPRPLWLSPAFFYATHDLAGLPRRLRIVGRNLRPVEVRLRGPATYTVAAVLDSAVAPLVAEAELPARMTPGSYTVAVSSDRRAWVDVPDQHLEIRPDPPARPDFVISAARFGACRANDGEDDSDCFAKALAAARQAGGGTVVLTAGQWDLSAEQRFVLAPNVSLRGEPQAKIVRHDIRQTRPNAALLNLQGQNAVTGLTFTDATAYESIQQSRPVIQLGAVADVIISGNTFMRVGRAVTDTAQPIRRLFVTHNTFGDYDNALLLTGAGASPAQPYRIDDTVVRFNRFLPGSYLDVPAQQGTIATQLGASYRVDFSDNVADGSAGEALQDPRDAPGWRAAFFWNLANNVEELLLAKNQISCSGDKAGDGEAVSFDGHGNTFGFDVAQFAVDGAADWVSIPAASLLSRQLGQPVPEDYYNGHWVTILQGPGHGQTRRIVRYSRVGAKIVLQVAPHWDVPPIHGESRIAVGRQFWQVYVVGNIISQAPPCHKSNRNHPRGGVIGFWTPVADSVVQANHQTQSDGIEFLNGYAAKTAACPSCAAQGSASHVTALEIRDNIIDGEYDWDDACSWSGIRSYFLATATPGEPPPPVGFGTVIAHNTIRHADGQRGGAIDIASAGSPDKVGPEPGDWTVVLNPLIFGNVIRDVGGAPPHPAQTCRQEPSPRVGIHVEGRHIVRDAVFDGNQCNGAGQDACFKP